MPLSLGYPTFGPSGSVVSVWASLLMVLYICVLLFLELILLCCDDSYSESTNELARPPKKGTSKRSNPSAIHSQDVS